MEIDGCTFDINAKVIIASLSRWRVDLSNETISNEREERRRENLSVLTVVTFDDAR